MPATSRWTSRTKGRTRTSSWWSDRTAADLPIRADGITVDEEAIEPLIAGAWEDAKPGTRDRLRLHLEPGRYVLFCNMAGHYLGGMHEALEVT